MSRVMTRDEMISVAGQVNKDTLDEHLRSCRAEINGLQKELRELYAALTNTVIDLPHDRVASLEEILASPKDYPIVHQRCGLCGNPHCYGHDDRTRQWWD